MRFFPFTHCQKIFKLLFPSSKNAATFSPMFAIRKNPHFQALGRVVVFFLYTAKNHLYYSPNKILKTSHCKLSVLKQEKRHLRHIAVLFFFSVRTVKNFNQLFPSSKTPQHQAICSQTGKNATSRQLCRAVFSLYALSKTIPCSQV